MNNLDRSIYDNLKLSRSLHARGWLHYQEVVDAILMHELARHPIQDRAARAFPHDPRHLSPR